MLDAMTVREPAARLRRVRPGVLAPGGAGASAAEFGLLVTIGVTAAVARSLLDLRLGVPGHSIVLVVPPFVLGLACVPRRMAGAVMGSSALAAALLVRVTAISRGMGSGALASLFLTGIFLDVALSLARSGIAIYALCLAAGLSSNMVAFALRFALKSTALSPGHLARSVSAWWPLAIWTYPLCGAIAGLVSAGLLFRARSQSRPARPVPWKLWWVLSFCAVALGLAALAVSRARPAQNGLGEAFSHECGERLGRLAARCLPGRSRVTVISGELRGFHCRLGWQVDGQSSLSTRHGGRVQLGFLDCHAEAVPARLLTDGSGITVADNEAGVWWFPWPCEPGWVVP